MKPHFSCIFRGYSANNHYEGDLRKALDDVVSRVENDQEQEIGGQLSPLIDIKNYETDLKPLQERIESELQKYLDTVKKDCKQEEPTTIILPSIASPNGIYGPRNSNGTTSDLHRVIYDKVRKAATEAVFNRNTQFLNQPNIEIMMY